MRKIIKTNEIAVLQEYVSVDHYDLLHAERHICAELGSGEYLLVFHYCDIRNASQRESKVHIYCSAQNLIYVCDSKECAKIAGGIDEKKEHYSQLLEFFVALCADDLHELEKIEDKITKLEDGMLTQSKRLDDSPAKIIAVRRELLKMKRYYEQLGLITTELADNESSVLPREIQTRFCALDRRIDHLLNFVLHLREYVTQVREAYQAQIDIQQNQIMKVFTVISAVFLPLTLIVGWYGMNMKMPEYNWNFGYAYVIILCVVFGVGCLAAFRYKKWF